MAKAIIQVKILSCTEERKDYDKDTDIYLEIEGNYSSMKKDCLPLDWNEEEERQREVRELD